MTTKIKLWKNLFYYHYNDSHADNTRYVFKFSWVLKTSHGKKSHRRH